MANNRLSMRKITETLRLHYECGRTFREISRAIGASPTTVSEYVRRAKAAGLGYPLPEGLDDSALELRLLPPVVASDVVRTETDWVWAHREMRKKSVTLELLWQEYKAIHPEGYQYSWFCERYRQWVGRLSVTLRQTHTPGEKLAHHLPSLLNLFSRNGPMSYCHQWPKLALAEIRAAQTIAIKLLFISTRTMQFMCKYTPIDFNGCRYPIKPDEQCASQKKR